MAYDSELDYKIVGSKGGKGGGQVASSASASPSEAANTVQSTAIAKVMDLICSGEISGWADADPLKCIFLDGTPIKNSDESINFQGILVDWRVGTPDQTHISGYDDQGNTTEVSIESTHSIWPIFSVVGTQVDAVSVAVSIPALVTTDTKTGNINGGTVEYAIDVQAAGSGTWITKLTKTLSEKFTSTFQIAHRIDLDGLARPVSVRLRRITADALDSTVQNKTYFAFATELVEAKLSYPNSAVVGITAEAKQFGDRIPSRTYKIRGQKCLIPANYNPETRAYTGMWDGTLKIGWTRNPAWIMFSLLVNKDWGLGDLIDLADVDRYSLYEIGQHCDEEVPDGFGGMEPRYQFDAYIQTREEAAKAIQAIAATFQGMVYATAAKVMFSQDREKDVKRLVTNANVLGGSFVYEGFARESRHSVAIVTWNDPAQLGKPAIEVVEDVEQIAKLQWKPTDVFAYGCASRGQARRMGRWVLFSEKYETRTCSFRTDLNFADVVPGDIVRVADQHRQGVRAGGRIVTATTTSATLDAPLVIESGVTYTIWLTSPDNTLFSKVLTNAVGTTSTVTWSGSHAVPQDETVFIITSTAFSPPLYKVLSITELSGRDPHLELVCVRHYEEKFANIEYDVPFSPNGETIYGLSSHIAPPTGGSVRRISNLLPGGVQEALEVSFTKSVNKFVFEYPYRWRFQKGAWEEGKTIYDNFQIPFRGDGIYDFIITARGPGNRESIPLVFSADGDGNTRPIDDPFVRNLRISGQDPTNLSFAGRVMKVEWDLGSPPGYDDTDEWQDPYFKDYEITLVDPGDNSILRHYYTTDRRFEYTAEMLFEDNAGVMIRSIKVTVAMRDKHDGVLGQSTKTFTNPPAGAPVEIIITSKIGGANILVKPPADPDVTEMVVWVNASSSSVVISEDPYLRTAQTSFELIRDTGQNLWFVVAFLDDWFQSIDELNLSSVQVISAKTITVEDLDSALQTSFELMTEIGQQAEQLATTIASHAGDISELAEAALVSASRDFDNQQYLDAKLHLGGVPIGTVVVSERSERIEGDTAIVEVVDLIGAKSADGTAFVLNTSTVRVSPTESFADHLLGIIATFDGNIAEVRDEITAAVGPDSALATDITTLYSRVGTAESAITTEATTRASAISTEASLRTTLASRVTTAESAITTESSTRATADSALAHTLSLIGAVNGTNTAFIIDESLVQVSAGGSFASRLTGLYTNVISYIDGQIVGVNSTIGSQSVSFTDPVTGSSYASDLHTVMTSVLAPNGSLNGSVSTLSSTVYTAGTGLVSRYGLRVASGNVITGFTLNNDSVSGDFIIYANKFAIVDDAGLGGGSIVPFSYSSGVVKMPYVEVGTIKARVVQSGALDFPGWTGHELDGQAVTLAAYAFPYRCVASIIGTVSFSNLNGVQVYVNAQLKKNGSVLYESAAYAYLLNPGYITMVWYDDTFSGTHTYEICATAYDTSGSTIGGVYVGSASISVEAKLNWT